MADPMWNEWAFWLKDPESVRNLAFTIGSIAAVIGGAVGLVLATLRSIAAMRQARAASETQVTKLLTDAIGFLADKDKLELRIGAIYSLERIAQKSKADLYRVLEILYAFLRENTSRRGAESDESPTIIPPDIQACLDVVARNPPPRTIFKRRAARLTLANVNLRSVDLRGAHLRGVHLLGADLRGADLSNSDLRRATLSKAMLNGARLQSCKLNGAELTETDFQDCQLEGAVLDLVKASNAAFNRANLQSARFDRAYLRGAKFTDANLTKADFSGSDVSEALFINANIAETDFRDRQISKGQSGSAVYPTNLVGADFTGANRELAKFQPPKSSFIPQTKVAYRWLVHRLIKPTINGCRRCILSIRNVYRRWVLRFRQSAR